MFDNNLEGYHATQKMWYYFWNPSVEAFTTQVPCHESHGQQFSCYAQAVAIHAIADAAFFNKEEIRPIAEKAVKATMKYRNPKYKAFSVDFHGGINSGDEDINYDDNAHLLRAMIQMYEALGNQKYLAICKEIQEFMFTGITEHQHWHIQGCKWHISRKYMATISNSLGAIAAIRMIKYAKSKEEEAKLYEFAKICMNFIWEKMRDPNDNIIMDGVGLDSDVIDLNKYSYNQGTSVSAYCMLYKYDGNPEWKEKADLLIDGCINPGKTLYDRDYKDNNKRFLSGVSYFNQLLFEGIADYIETFQTNAPSGVIDQCKKEMLRHMSYFRKYCFDPKDQMYYMNFDIYRIDDKTYQMFKQEFGGTKPFKPDPRERQKEMDDVPVEKRPIVRSLIGAGAAAHIFFQFGRIFPKVDPVPC